jgi:peptidylprolyl isomerase
MSCVLKLSAAYDVPTKLTDRPKLKPKKTMPPVTKKVYFDIQIESENIGRIVFGLFGTIAPRTVENFYSLCVCDKGNGKLSGKPLCYKGTQFHRIIPNFMIQGGDITSSRKGNGGESIYGGLFEDESFEVKHNTVHLLSMAHRGSRNTNGSQFFINTVKTSWLDGKHVVFGMVLEGKDVIDAIEAWGTNIGTPKAKIVILDSGVYNDDTASL